MSLKDLEIKHEYDSDEDCLPTQFYVPVLSESVKYYRRSGFFSSSSLAVSAQGLAELIKKDGKMKLICSVHLSKEDYNSIERVLDDPYKFLEESDIGKDLDNIGTDFERDHVEALGWMLANGFLEIKIAFPKTGTYHPKVGIFIDEEGNYLSFSGSQNETFFGMFENVEEFKVFRSWKNDWEKKDADSDLERFEKEWAGNRKRTVVIDLPKFLEEKLVKFAPHEKADLKLLDGHYYSKHKKPKLSLPSREYQDTAVSNWFNNDCKGIFNMATGTGKTITALNCFKQLMQESETNFLTLIACPQTYLVHQWSEEIKKYFDNDIFSTVGNSSWSTDLQYLLGDVDLGNLKYPILLTTHQLFHEEEFTKIMKHYIKKYEIEVFIIVDEAHGVGASKYQKGLLPCYPYRLGLTATPERHFDDEGTKFVCDYFEGTVCKFTLKQAIKKGFLTEYCYIPHFVSLDGDELERYLDLTKKIAIKYDKIKNFEDISLTKDFLDRQAIIDNASSKFLELKKILEKEENMDHLLVYCTSNHEDIENKQIKQVYQILSNMDIIPSYFTGEEKNKSSIIKDFEEDDGEYKALVAMKCLDEGVDIPSAKTAIFMSSTSNPREYIQRRGRILRKYPGKDMAIIHDLLVLPPLKNLTKSERTIIDKELARFYDFRDDANLRSYNYCNKLLKEWMDINGE